MDSLHRIGERIRERRTYLGWTQGMLAQKIGLDPGSVGHYEAGRREMPAGTLVEIANALRTTVSALVGEDEEVRNQANTPQYKVVASSEGVIDLTPEEQRLLDLFVRGVLAGRDTDRPIRTSGKTL